ncbi:hypothetical protein [Stappia stellulata]|uniref:hypothetical protein n=1 Tax=Stappia stellulata TaxID=71235 RepID=UPI00042921D3|nr:hypothetical protein [Stappia stellulata]
MDRACFLMVFAVFFALMPPVANLSLAGDRAPGDARRVSLVGRAFLAGVAMDVTVTSLGAL